LPGASGNVSCAYPACAQARTTKSVAMNDFMIS
jgi:hypothetical protein